MLTVGRHNHLIALLHPNLGAVEGVGTTGIELGA
jgi:hypothetical protein